MPRGVSLHVGVNELDPDCFESAPLDGCVNDAAAMYYVAKARGFTDRRLLADGDATYERVTAAIRRAAGRLRGDGDVFLFTFAGHGTRVPDFEREPGGFKDETMVLHDRILTDGELRRRYLPLFNPGVRVIFVTDSCHNGTLLREPAADEPGFGKSPVNDEAVTGMTAGLPATGEQGVAVAGRPREMSPFDGLNHMKKFAKFYDELRGSLRAAGPLQCSALHLAACKDSLPTPDGPTHGVFTQALLDVLDGGFGGTYEELRLAVAARTALVPGGRRPFIEEEGVPLSPPFKHRRPVFAI